MENGFDFESGCLFGEFGRVKFDLQLRGKKVQVLGDSATGKTMIANILKNDSQSGKFNNIMEYPNVHVIDSTFKREILEGYSSSLILIDRGDLILTPDIVLFIRTDRRNKYLIFARCALGLGISPNYFGHLKLNGDGFLRIEYMCSERGWF